MQLITESRHREALEATEIIEDSAEKVEEIDDFDEYDYGNDMKGGFIGTDNDIVWPTEEHSPGNDVY